MILTSAQSYWAYRRKYLALAPAAKRMSLQGEALLLLRDMPAGPVRRRMHAFINEECGEVGAVNKTASFV